VPEERTCAIQGISNGCTSRIAFVGFLDFFFFLHNGIVRVNPVDKRLVLVLLDNQGNQWRLVDDDDETRFFDS
jgi:hypothetical protein